jgi:phage shock protein A
MDDTTEAKLAVLDAMNVSLGKLTNVQVRLTLAGEATLADQIATNRQALLVQIEKLQGQVADQWTVKAATLTDQLRVANSDLQTRIRNIRNQIDVANNAIAIIGQIDGALKFLAAVVP